MSLKNNNINIFVVLALIGELELQDQQAAQRNPSRHYLTRPDLPNPQADTPWQHMYAAQNDRAFITTMGFDVDTFGLILQGFQAEWELNHIERSDVNPNGEPRLGARSLNAAGVLGLVLHYIHSCMTETSLQQIFGLVPATVDRYIQFGLRILDSG